MPTFTFIFFFATKYLFDFVGEWKLYRLAAEQYKEHSFVQKLIYQDIQLELPTMITFSYCNNNITKGFHSINTDSFPSILLMYCILKQLYSFFFLSSSCMFDHTFSYTSHTSQSYQPIYTGTIVTKCHKL